MSITVIVCVVMICLALGIFVYERVNDKKEVEGLVKPKEILEERESESTQKQKSIHSQQEELIQQYVNSPLVHEILKYICRGDYKQNRPAEIIINRNNIQSYLYGQKIVYDFMPHRVPEFQQVFYCCRDPYLDIVEPVKPQVAMAEAINRIMGNEYNIFDKAKYTFKEVVHSDMTTDTMTFYKSDYVLMQPKAMRKF